MVDIANHGQEAIEMISKKEYDAVLMDIQMPVMDGYTATKYLRKDERYSKLPILVMTANATTDDREKSLKVGMNAHINKPINPGDLFNALLTWIEPRVSSTTEATKQEIIEQSIEIETAPELEGIDAVAVVARVGGSIAAYWRLLGKFIDNQADSVGQVEVAVAEKDQELAVRVAHSLKGASGALGVLKVQELAGQLEGRLKDGLAGVEESLYQGLRDELGRVIENIRSAMPSSTNDSMASSVGLTPEIMVRFSLLQQQLDDYDAEAEDTLLELRADMGRSEFAGMLEPIIKAVSAYDMEAAGEHLTAVINSLEEEYGE